MFFHDSVMKRLALTGGQMQVQRILRVRTKPKLIGNMGFELWSKVRAPEATPRRRGMSEPTHARRKAGKEQLPRPAQDTARLLCRKPQVLQMYTAQLHQKNHFNKYKVDACLVCASCV